LNALELKVPLKIKSGLIYFKFGKMQKVNDALIFNNGFVSARKNFSMFEKGVLVYYYQTKIFFKEFNKDIYIMIPEDQQAKVFFDPDLESLMSFVQGKILEVNKDVTHSSSLQKHYNFLNLFPHVENNFLYNHILQKFKDG
jgi:hypothetical protein